MAPALVHTVAAQDVPHLAVLIAALVAVGALVRICLCILAAFAVHKALSDAGEDSPATRKHRLEVLRLILGALTRQTPWGPGRGGKRGDAGGAR
jgi:hypothetical protein